MGKPPTTKAKGKSKAPAPTPAPAATRFVDDSDDADAPALATGLLLGEDDFTLQPSASQDEMDVDPVPHVASSTLQVGNKRRRALSTLAPGVKSPNDRPRKRFADEDSVSRGESDDASPVNPTSAGLPPKPAGRVVQPAGPREFAPRAQIPSDLPLFGRRADIPAQVQAELGEMTPVQQHYVESLQGRERELRSQVRDLEARLQAAEERAKLAETVSKVAEGQGNLSNQVTTLLNALQSSGVSAGRQASTLLHTTPGHLMVGLGAPPRSEQPPFSIAAAPAPISTSPQRPSPSSAAPVETGSTSGDFAVRGTPPAARGPSLPPRGTSTPARGPDGPVLEGDVDMDLLAHEERLKATRAQQEDVEKDVEMMHEAATTGTTPPPASAGKRLPTPAQVVLTGHTVSTSPVHTLNSAQALAILQRLTAAHEQAQLAQAPQIERTISAPGGNPFQRAAWSPMHATSEGALAAIQRSFSTGQQPTNVTFDPRRLHASASSSAQPQATSSASAPPPPSASTQRAVSAPSRRFADDGSDSDSEVEEPEVPARGGAPVAARGRSGSRGMEVDPAPAGLSKTRASKSPSPDITDIFTQFDDDVQALEQQRQHLESLEEDEDAEGSVEEVEEGGEEVEEVEEVEEPGGGGDDEEEDEGEEELDEDADGEDDSEVESPAPAGKGKGKGKPAVKAKGKPAGKAKGKAAAKASASTSKGATTARKNKKEKPARPPPTEKAKSLRPRGASGQIKASSSTSSR